LKFFSLREKGRKIQLEPENEFRHTLNMLLHYLVKLLIRSDMVQIWKKLKTKSFYFLFWFPLNIFQIADIFLEQA